MDYLIAGRREFFRLPTKAPPDDGIVRRGQGGYAGRKRRKRWREFDAYADMLLALNCLAHGKSLGWRMVPFAPIIPGNVAQRLPVHYLQGITDAAIRRGLLGPLETTERNAEPDYVGNITNSRVWLDPEALSLPEERVAGTANVLELLPASKTTRCEASRELMRDAEEEEECPRPFLEMAPGKYLELISLFERNQLIILQREKPRVVNGIFAVSKEETRQRLIVDARPSNAVLRPHPRCSYPTRERLPTFI
jgi:hypothetical protein